MKKIKLPSSTVLVMGGLGSFWLVDIVNPGFFPIGIMIFLLIPVLIIELLYPESEIEKLLVAQNPIPNEEVDVETDESEVLATGEVESTGN